MAEVAVLSVEAPAVVWAVACRKRHCLSAEQVRYSEVSGSAVPRTVVAVVAGSAAGAVGT